MEQRCKTDTFIKVCDTDKDINIDGTEIAIDWTGLNASKVFILFSVERISTKISNYINFTIL